jgi:hypothetical protein
MRDQKSCFVYKFPFLAYTAINISTPSDSDSTQQNCLTDTQLMPKLVYISSDTESECQAESEFDTRSTA